MVIYVKFNLDNRSSLQDKSKKLLFYTMKEKAHNFFFEPKSYNIVFLKTENAETGQMGDIKYHDMTNGMIRLCEFQSTPLDLNKLRDIFDYHEDERTSVYNMGVPVQTNIICTYSPNRGIRNGIVYECIDFVPNIMFTRDIDGWKILNTLQDKCKKQIVLDDDDQVGLLILPDTNIDIHPRELLELTCKILVNAKIPQFDYDMMVICQIPMLNRFFNKEEVMRMIGMLKPSVEDQSTRIS